MTSKNSFYKILKTALRNRMWGLALSMTGFFFVLPVYAALCISTIKDRIMMLVYTPESGCGLFARDALGENNALLMVVVAGLGIFLAFNGFSYLYSKSKTDLFHSMPVKRETIFAAEYLAGVITYIVPYVLFMLLAFVVGSVNGMLDGRGVGTAMIMLFINLLGFMAIYNTTIIAIVMTGNIGVGVLATAVFFLYGIVANILFTGYESAYFYTKSQYSQNMITSHCSPLTAYFNLTDGMGSFRGMHNLKAGNFALFVVFILVTLAIALCLFKNRPSEAAGKSMAFKKSMPVVSVLILIIMALAGGIVFEQFSRNGISRAYGWYIFGFAASLIFGHFVIQAIYYQDFKSLFKNLLNPAIGGAVAAVIALVFILDLTGYDSYIPGESDVEKMAIASYDMQGNIEYYDFGGEEDEYGSHNIGRDLIEYRLNNINITDKQLIHDFAEIGVADTAQNYAEEVNSYGMVSKEYPSEDVYVVVYAKYTLKNGKEVNRMYHIKLAKHMDLYDRIYSDKSYKAVVCPMMNLDDEDAGDICYADIFGNADVKFSSMDMKKLVKAYREDVSEQDVYSLKDEIPYGYLYKAVSYRDSSYVQIYNTNKAFIYPSFKRTVAILESYGINLDYYKNDISNIKSIVINNYSNIDDMGNPTTKEYTDKADIEAILENSYPADLTYAESVLFVGEPLDIMVNFENTPYGYGYNMCYVARKDMLPDFVSREVK